MNNEDVDLFFNNNFTEKEIHDFLYHIAIAFVQDNFINSSISNSQYEKNVFKIIQKSIITQLILKFNSETEFCHRLSLYLFKKYFKLIFQFISQRLLKEVALSNQNVIEFLKYYSHNTIVVNQKKYTVPKIQLDNGLTWNVTSMMSILKTYIKTQEYVDTIEIQLLQLEAKLKDYFIMGLSPIEHNKKIEIEFTILNQNILMNATQISILQDSSAVEKDSIKSNEIQNSLSLQKDLRLKLREEKAKLTKQKVKQVIMSEYQAIIKEIENLRKTSKAELKMIETNKETYCSIVHALATALISKKKIL